MLFGMAKLNARVNDPGNCMILSVLIPTLPERRLLFNDVHETLLKQRQALPQRDSIEIVSLMDQGQRSIGKKRNELKHLAKGEYIVFVDDDDAVAESYLEAITEGILRYSSDVVTFHALVTLNGSDPKTCIYSSAYECDANLPTHYERLPNHLCPVRAKIAPDFRDISFGEDAQYARDLKPKIASDAHIAEVLYYYRYSNSTSRSLRKH